jgi:hypothetical protein
MTVMLITALQAAETLGAHHGQRVDLILGARQQWHAEMARLCEENVEDIGRQLAAGGDTAENQARGGAPGTSERHSGSSRSTCCLNGAHPRRLRGLWKRWRRRSLMRCGKHGAEARRDNLEPEPRSE